MPSSRASPALTIEGRGRGEKSQSVMTPKGKEKPTSSIGRCGGLWRSTAELAPWAPSPGWASRPRRGRPPDSKGGSLRSPESPVPAPEAGGGRRKEARPEANSRGTHGASESEEGEAGLGNVLGGERRCQAVNTLRAVPAQPSPGRPGAAAHRSDSRRRREREATPRRA